MKTEVKLNFSSRNILLALFSLALVLSLIEFFEFRDFELDESWILLNVIHRNFFELLRPLDYHQIAPPGFLWSIKFLHEFFPDKSQVLRLYSLFFFLLSIGPVYYVFKPITTQKTAWWILFMLIINPVVLFYATQVKQYGADLFFYYIIVALTIFYSNRPHLKNFLFLALSGTIAPWFSNVAVLSLPLVFLFLMVRFKFNTQFYKHLLLLFSIWITSVGVNYFLFIHDHPTKSYMVPYWLQRNALLNGNNIISFGKTVMYVISKECLRFFGPFKYLGFIIFLGIYKLWSEKNYTALFWTLGPFFMHLIASSIKIYPFQTLMALYLFPVFLLWLIKALEWIFKRYQTYALIALAGYYFIYLISVFPHRGDQIDAILSHINKTKSRIFIHEKIYYPLLFRLENQHQSMPDNWLRFDENLPEEKFHQDDIIVLFQDGKKPFVWLQNKIKKKIAADNLKISDSIVLYRAVIYHVQPSSNPSSK